jgi:hypothetical protein
MNGVWRLVGTITDMTTIVRCLRGSLLDFHYVWTRGFDIEAPERK